MFLLMSCDTKTAPISSQNHLQDSISEPPKPLFYGIDTADYKLSSFRVKKNETMSDIFKRLNIPYKYLLRSLDYDSVFNIKKIKSGELFYVLKSKADTSLIPDYLIYEHNLKQHTIFDFHHPFSVYSKTEPLVYKQLLFSGTINSSLWNALKDLNTSPELAIDLSEIYAWSFDFFGLQKGDKFSFFTKASYINGELYRYESITSALFEHYGHQYFAFFYEQDSTQGFYDENGDNLRKTFLKAPLRYSRISSRFSHSRLHPVLKIRRPHHGVDYAAPRGTPVCAIGDGRIIKKGWDKGGGRFVKIKHNSVYTTTYMHFSKFGKFKKGDWVKQGDIVGYVGSSGLATGPHLDFRFYKNGKAIDPLKVKSPPAKSISDSTLSLYKKEIEPLKQSLLNSISEN